MRKIIFLTSSEALQRWVVFSRKVKSILSILECWYVPNCSSTDDFVSKSYNFQTFRHKAVLLCWSNFLVVNFSKQSFERGESTTRHSKMQETLGFSLFFFWEVNISLSVDMSKKYCSIIGYIFKIKQSRIFKTKHSNFLVIGFGLKIFLGRFCLLIYS